jgi:hypothetical protein
MAMMCGLAAEGPPWEGTPLVGRQRKHRPMSNVQYVHGLIEHHKEKPISPAVARAEKQLADR